MKYPFSGDSYVDYVLTYWFDWWNESNKTDYDLTSEQCDEMFLYKGFDKLAEIIFEEFPMCADTKNCDFDAEWCWNKFLDTKEGKIAQDYLDKVVSHQIIDASIVGEYLDYNLIAESLDSNEIALIKEYLKNDKDAKQLKKSDLKEIEVAFTEGVMGKLSNGFTFMPDEYAEVRVCANDEDNTTAEDLNQLMKHQKDELKRGNLLVRTSTYNPHLYNGEDIDFVFEILLGNLIYDAVNY